MKIAIVSSLHGGVGTFVTNLARELANYVDFIGLYAKMDTKRVIYIKTLPENVKIFKLGDNEIAFWVKLFFHIHELSKYDLIHVIAPISFLQTFLISKLWRTPIIFTTHGPSLFQEFRAFSMPWFYINLLEDVSQKLMMSIAKRTITISREVQRRVLNRYNVSSEVVYHGVDQQHFRFDSNRRSTLRKVLGIKDEYLILFVGPLWRHKDILTLIEAIPKVLGNNRKVKFLIIGRGPDYKKMIQKINDLNINNCVITLEYVKDVAQYYSAADIFVMPSIKEEFGLVYLEAMACGLPVIAVNGHVVPEIVGDAGLLFEPRNSDDLASKIIELMNNKELYKKLKRKGLERAKRFTWEKAAKRYHEIYKEVLGRR